MFQEGYSAATVGVGRVLNLFKKYDIKATFFTPDLSAESFGSQVERSEMPATKCKALLPLNASNHALGFANALSSGLHGHTHEFISQLLGEQGRDVLVKSIHVIMKQLPSLATRNRP